MADPVRVAPDVQKKAPELLSIEGPKEIVRWDESSDEVSLFDSPDGKHAADKLRREAGSPIGRTKLICQKDCAYWQQCTLTGTEFPIADFFGQPCPEEQFLIKEWFNEYAEELRIGPKDISDIAQLKELIVCMVFERRMQSDLAKNPTGDIEYTVAVDPRTGNPIRDRKMNPLFTPWEKISKRKAALLKSFMVTREMRSKEEARKMKAPSQQMANLVQKWRERENADGSVEREVVVESPQGMPTPGGSLVDAMFNTHDSEQEKRADAAKRGN